MTPTWSKESDMHRPDTLQRVRSAFMIGLFSATIGLASTARAQFLVSEMGPSALNHMLTQINTWMQQGQDYSEYAQQAQRWYQTYQHYQQQLVRLQGLFMSQGLSLERPLAEVPDDWNVQSKCGGGFSVANLVSALTPGDDVIEKQREICGRIQMAQNRKFNATVRFMREIAPKLDQKLSEIRQRRNSSNDEGNMTAVAVDAQNFNNWMNGEFQSWDMQMKMYDNYVVTLQETQKTLAEVALKGDKSRAIGSPVKTTALQGALTH
jgi:hypothetical protein